MICILGMHRSGTSCVAGTLQRVGVHLGDVFTANRYNPKGNRENKAILALHDELLDDNGGRWDDPPADVRWSRGYRIRRDQIIAELSAAAPRWGFKDPRTLLTLDGWLEVQPNPSFVGVLRHPLAVAHSLEHRSGMPVRRALALWTRYNEHLAATRARFDFPIVCFDVPASALVTALRTLCGRLELDPAAAEAFFDDDLRHHHADATWTGVSDAARRLYDGLRAQAL